MGKRLYREYDNEGNLTKLECTKCKEIKTVDNFFKDKYAKDGYKIRCKQCLNVTNNKRKYREYDTEGNLTKLQCSKCKQIKSVDKFSKCKNKIDGYSDRCKECSSKYQKEHYMKNHKIKTLYREYDGGKLIKLECSKCEAIKEVSCFYTSKECKDGINPKCKECQKIENKERHFKNREEINKKSREYYQENKELIKKKHKKYCENNKEKIAELQKQYYLENKDKIRERVKEYQFKNKDKIRERVKEYQFKNKDKIKIRAHKYYLNNKEKINNYNNQYNLNHKERMNEWKKQYYKDNIENISIKRKQYTTINREKIIKHSRDLRKNKGEKEIKRIYENVTKNLYPNNGIQYGVIYGVHCIPTDRWYIGQTVRSFNIRYDGDFFTRKFHGLSDDNPKLQLLHEDIEKYGKDNFEIFEVIDVAFSEKELDEKEAYYIDYYKAYDEGYNSNRGNIFKHNKSKRKEVI